MYVSHMPAAAVHIQPRSRHATLLALASRPATDWLTKHVRVHSHTKKRYRLKPTLAPTHQEQQFRAREAECAIRAFAAPVAQVEGASQDVPEVDHDGHTGIGGGDEMYRRDLVWDCRAQVHFLQNSSRAARAVTACG